MSDGLLGSLFVGLFQRLVIIHELERWHCNGPRFHNPFKHRLSVPFFLSGGGCDGPRCHDPFEHRRSGVDGEGGGVAGWERQRDEAEGREVVVWSECQGSGR